MPRRSRAGEIVTGPIVRYVDQRQANIWLELPAEAALFGTARAVRGRSKARESEVARTVEVDRRHYAMIYFDKLEPDALYRYELHAVFDTPGPYAWPREIKRHPKRVVLDLSHAAMGGLTRRAINKSAPAGRCRRIGASSCWCSLKIPSRPTRP